MMPNDTLNSILTIALLIALNLLMLSLLIGLVSAWRGPVRKSLQCHIIIGYRGSSYIIYPGHFVASRGSL